VNEIIANALMNQIKGLVFKEYNEGWRWEYKERYLCEYYSESPLDAFIDFTNTVLETNDKLTGRDISYDED
jgi:hypothetical protein